VIDHQQGTAALWAAAPRCAFYIRTQVTDAPTYRYDAVDLAAYGHWLVTPVPPAAGDLVHLFDRSTKTGGTYRVIGRAWSYSSYGSAAWPLGQLQPSQGPVLDVIVEAADGPFVNQVDATA
jgi:hypothetical protein